MRTFLLILFVPALVLAGPVAIYPQVGAEDPLYEIASSWLPETLTVNHERLLIPAPDSVHYQAAEGGTFNVWAGKVECRISYRMDSILVHYKVNDLPKGALLHLGFCLQRDQDYDTETRSGYRPIWLTGSSTQPIAASWHHIEVIVPESGTIAVEWRRYVRGTAIIPISAGSMPGKASPIEPAPPKSRMVRDCTSGFTITRIISGVPVSYGCPAGYEDLSIQDSATGLIVHQDSVRLRSELYPCGSTCCVPVGGSAYCSPLGIGYESVPCDCYRCFWDHYFHVRFAGVYFNGGDTVEIRSATPAPESVDAYCRDSVVFITWEPTPGIDSSYLQLFQDGVLFLTDTVVGADSVSFPAGGCREYYATVRNIGPCISMPTTSPTCNNGGMPESPSFIELERVGDSLRIRLPELDDRGEYRLVIYQDSVVMFSEIFIYGDGTYVSAPYCHTYQVYASERSLCGESFFSRSPVLTDGLNAPFAPHTPFLTVSDSVIVAMWNRCAGATSYRVTLLNALFMEFRDTLVTDTTIWFSPELADSYLIAICAVNPCGESYRVFSSPPVWWTPSLRASVSESLNVGWNLLSWPLRLPDLRPLASFPNAYSAFIYSPTTRDYLRADSLAIPVEQGFWLLMGRDTSAMLTGQRIDSLVFDVPSGGWVLCGNTTNGATVESLRTEPPGLRVGSVYTYQPGSGYTAVATGRIPPGRGFWMLMTGAGRVIVR